MNTVFYAVVTVSYGKEYFKVSTKTILSLLNVTFSMEKRERKKASAGHESDKLIELYNAQSTIEQKFE